MGGAGGVGAPADERGAWLCRADPVPPVRRREARRPVRRAITSNHRRPPARGARRPSTGEPAPDEAGARERADHPGGHSSGGTARSTPFSTARTPVGSCCASDRRTSTSSAACWMPLWSRPQRRRPGQRGRPRRRAAHVPTPQVLAASCRHWRPLPLTLYGRRFTPAVFALTALWYAALPDYPLRIVAVRDPSAAAKMKPSSATTPT